jgi:hypothetical protein
MEKVWESRTNRFAGYVDPRNKQTKKAQMRELVDPEGWSTHRESSSLIWRNEVQLLHDWREFSWPLRYFVQRYPLHLLGWRIPVMEA